MKPTTDNLKALGYRLVNESSGVYFVRRPDGRSVPNSYAANPSKAWDLAREFVAREIAIAQAVQP